MNFYEKILESKEIFKGKMLNLKLDSIKLPNGKISTREVVSHPGSVCIAALTQDKKIAFVKQYRHAIAKTILELPAGKLEKDEIPICAAKRELSEETGINGSGFKSLGFVYISPGYSGEIMHLYMCKAESQKGLNLDEDEFLQPTYLDFSSALSMVLNDELHDAKTQICILKIAKLISRGELNFD